MRGGHARIGLVHQGFDAVELALLQVAELLLAAGRCGRGFSARRWLLHRRAAGRGGLPLLPLRVVGEGARVAEAVEAQHHIRHAVEHVAVMRDQHKRALELQQRLFQDLERGDVEIVGRLVEHQHVRRLQHQPRDQYAGALAAAQALDWLVELVACEQELRGVARYMHDAVLIDHRIRVRRKRAAQRERGIQLAHLREVDYTQVLGALDVARCGSEFAGHRAQNRRLAAAVRADQTKLHAVDDAEAHIRNNRAATKSKLDLVELDQPLGLAVGRVELDARAEDARARVHLGELADQAVRIVDAGLGLRCSGLRSAPQPLDLGLHAVAQTLLHLALGLHVELAAFEKLAVAAAHAEGALGIDAAQLDDLAGHVLQEVAVVRDHDAREARGAQHGLQPLDALEVEMVRRLVEQQHVRLHHHRLGDREPLAPASAQTGGFCVHADGGVRAVVGEAGLAERLAQALLVLVLRNTAAVERGLQHAAHRRACGVLGDLLHVADARALAHGDFARIGFHLAGEDGEQRGLARAVRPDQADAVAFIHGKRNIFKQGRRAKALAHALRVQDWRHRLLVYLERSRTVFPGTPPPPFLG